MNIALGIEHNIADEDVLNDAFLNTFERWYFILADYKKNLSFERKFDPWSPLDKLHERWFPQKHNSTKNKQKTLTGKLEE